mmetsp:Transcript_102791/g.257871  ORF Transcript_102791/g.257871 Transcript_102791/m.257871 type:complete len:321 (+) Transcript_102791:735-1697(+)
MDEVSSGPHRHCRREADSHSVGQHNRILYSLSKQRRGVAEDEHQHQAARERTEILAEHHRHRCDPLPLHHPLLCVHGNNVAQDSDHEHADAHYDHLRGRICAARMVGESGCAQADQESCQVFVTDKAAAVADDRGHSHRGDQLRRLDDDLDWILHPCHSHVREACAAEQKQGKPSVGQPELHARCHRGTRAHPEALQDAFGTQSVSRSEQVATTQKGNKATTSKFSASQNEGHLSASQPAGIPRCCLQQHLHRQHAYEGRGSQKNDPRPALRFCSGAAANGVSARVRGNGAGGLGIVFGQQTASARGAPCAEARPEATPN